MKLESTKHNHKQKPVAVPKDKLENKPTIKTKLTIGKSNDSYEQEADRVADKVVRQSNTSLPQTPLAVGAQNIQKAEEEEVQAKAITKIQRQEEEEVQTKPIPGIQREAEEELQAKSETQAQPTASAAETRQIQNAEGGGSPLPTDIRKSMESGIGANFNNVRIHTDQRAENLSQQLHAQAFTVGNDIYFNKGKYNPDSQGGKHLLAHELTHTVQQGAAVQKKIQKQEEDAQLREPKLGRKEAQPASKFGHFITLDGFVTGKHQLLDAHKTILKEQTVGLASALATNPKAHVEVTGHADAVGEDEDNQALSERRAQSAANELMVMGIPAGQIRSSGMGESALRVQSNGPEAANRRVEIRLVNINARLEENLELSKEPKKEDPHITELLKMRTEDFIKPPDPDKLDMEHMQRVWEAATPVDNEITFDKAFDNARNTFLDGIGASGLSRDVLDFAIKKGVNSGIDAGVDAALDSAGLGSQEKKAVKTFIKTWRKHGLKKGKTEE